MDLSRLLGWIFIHLGVIVCETGAFKPNGVEFPRRVNKVKGEWGKWGAWSACSVECGTGISSRTRRCEHPLTLSVSSLIQRVDDTVECEGGGREIRVCNKHRCPANVENLREKQCNKFNARAYNGKKYKWEPYINPNNKCELTCRAKGQHFYARLANRVGDGTPCGINSLAVCIHRKCLDVGCDNMVGSNAKLDKCGVCKGDNSTCRTISGIFTRRDLPHGYSKIITIPKGSANINITELKPSTNYLSLGNNAGSILNGDYKISPSGDYDAAGTTFVYKKESLECPGECLFALGPTNETMELMMLVYHRNPGVLYSFNVPTDVKDSYFKEIISRNNEQNSKILTRTPMPEHANIQMEGDNKAEPFREELDDSQPEQHIEDIDEGVQERPSAVKDETNNAGNGDKQYSFLEPGQTVVLKANAGDWLHSRNESESQSQKGPSFVLSEQGSDIVDDEDSQSIEVVEGESIVFDETDEEDVSEPESDTEDDDDDFDDNVEYDSNEDVEVESVEDNIGIGREISAVMRVNMTENDTQVDSSVPDESFSTTEKDKNQKEILFESAPTMKSELTPKQPLDNYQDEMKAEEETYDESRGDETLGLGDAYSEPKSKPLPTESGYKTHQEVSMGNGRGLDSRAPMPIQQRPQPSRAPMPIHRRPQPSRAPMPIQRRPQPTSSEAPVRAVESTAPSSTVPQRDSRFKTYSRTLGHSDVTQSKTLRRTRPYSRVGIRRNNRVPKYSQSFTFRDRYRSMITAHRNRRLHRQRQQLLASRAVTSSPVNRRIPSRQVTQSRPSYPSRPTERDNRRTQAHHNKHRHNHRQEQNNAGITTSPPIRRIDPNSGRQSQSLHLGSVSESKFAPSKDRTSVSSSGVGSSVTLRANIGNNNQDQSVPRRDHRLSSGYRTNHTRSRTGGHQPSVNSRVSPKPFDRAIDPRQRPPNQTIRKSTGEKDADGRVIVDETLALGNLDRRRTDRRIVMPQQPVGVVRGREVINQQPVVSTRPRYDRLDTRSRNGEPLTKYSGSVDPVSGHPSLNSRNRALSGGRSYTKNIIPTHNRQQPLVSTRGGSNEILGSNYVWRVSGFSECTQTCGGGVQQTVVVCVDTRTQAVVTDENCAGLRKPAATALTCNTRPCQASWHMTPWSSCSKSCGPGAQSRTVTCKSRVSATLNLTMPEDSCTEEKPRSRQACQLTPCYKWNTGNWSKCSVRCGEGTKQREVSCTDANDRIVTSQLCPGLKPTNQEDCNMGSCGKGWYFTNWPEECPVSCGEGRVVRKAMCAGEGGAVLDDDRCDRLSKPDTEKTCRVDTPCGGNWFIGEWSKCNSTCGYAIKSRDVVCVKSVPGGILAVVSEDNCKGVEKPETEDQCDLDPCQSEWYMTSWAECSQTCGTGQRTREVKCLDPDQQPSGDCDTKSKPRSREPCNTQSCIRRPKPTTASGGSCSDSFSQCKLVKKARLCRYAYYAKMCCLSCANET